MKLRKIARMPRLGGLFLFGLVLAGCQGDISRTGSENSPPAITEASPATPEPEGANCCEPSSSADTAARKNTIRKITIPDVPVVDQDGRSVHFYSDLVKGKVVAINFVFTSCKTACPSLGLNFGKLQEKLGDRFGSDVFLISVSVDPMVDQPARLKEWAGRFGARPGWALVTAAEEHRADLDRLLKALQGYKSEKSDHAQTVLVVDGDSLEALTSSKVASPEELKGMVGQALLSRGSRNYFTDTTLVDQDGHRYRFYSDLLKASKVVVLHCFFTSCKTNCTVTNASLIKLQELLGERLGRDVVFLSLTVDPDSDTVPELAKYAQRCGARPGWHFLTGTKEDLARVQEGLWPKVETREAHSWVMVVGNPSAGLWRKHPDDPRDPKGLRDVAGLYKKVEEALTHDAKSLAAGQ
jgi:cytochrome oxidase Cu insertion factor (SCO1/SenC/PrrC family)